MNPGNELERILGARDFGPQVYPDLFRLLLQSPLVFLLPYHPELVGNTVTVKTGDDLPRFIIWHSDAGGRRIPIFTSPRSANEACEKIGARDHQFAFAEMDGKGLFELLACQPEAIVLNPCCGTHAIFLDLNAVKGLADGSMFKPDPGETTQGVARIVDPADYPTDFLQPLFAFLRKRPEVRAAWLFREVFDTGSLGCYVIVLKTTGDGTVIRRDFEIVATCACPKDAQYGVMLWDPANLELVKTTSTSTPFYAAPDYKAASPVEISGRPAQTHSTAEANCARRGGRLSGRRGIARERPEVAQVLERFHTSVIVGWRQRPPGHRQFFGNRVSGPPGNNKAARWRRWSRGAHQRPTTPPAVSG